MLRANALPIDKLGNASTPCRYASGTNQLVGIGDEKISYDATGSRVEDTRFTYAYNACGRLAVLTNKKTGVTTRYQYRLDGLRSSKTSRDNTTFYVYDASQRLVAESDSKGDILKEYLWLGYMPLAVLENDKVYYIHPDHLGTPRLVTNKYKQVVWQWQSTPFGKGKPNENGLTLNLRFPGQYYDDETGLHYNWFRYYEPETGRYITSDPIGLRGGVNRYIYVSQKALQGIDINGLAILIQSHQVVPNLVPGISADHSKITIIPENQNAWKNHPFFKNTLPDGRHFLTIGAGPSDGLFGGELISEINRERDINYVLATNNKYSSCLRLPNGIPEDIAIQALLIADANYNDSLTYEFLPDTSSSGYNSNSYIYGLLLSVGINASAPPNTPGFYKPVPYEYFRNKQ